jgi:translation initiation factor IF-3
VRVIGKSGKQLGILPIRKAIEKAKKAELDLVEIAPKARPPVTRIVDFGKFKYQEEKKLKAQKKGAKSGEVKEVRFSPFIGDADYKTRVEKIKEFLKERYKIRAVVKFKGRQMGSKQFGYNLLKKILSEFDDSISVDMKPKFVGRHLTMVISPTTKSKKVKCPSKKPENH